jgi:hypothetical protein
MQLNKNKAGLMFGGFLGAWHLLWGILVATGAAQAFLDWIYWLHFLNNPFTVAAFDVVRALTLIVVTAVIGYVIGWFCALLWNCLHKSAY